MKRFIFFILIISVTINFQDAFSQGKNMRLLKKMDLFPAAKTSELWGYSANGREYAIVGGNSGTFFVDITDSANMHSVDFVPGTEDMYRLIKTYSHYAYICSMAPNSGVQIVDLQYLPDSVGFVRQFNAAGHSFTHTIQQSGPYLYLCGGNASFTEGVAVLDLSVNPEQPVLRGKWSEMYVHDCRVVNDTIWAANFLTGKFSVINAVDKNNLSTVTSWANGPFPAPHSCALTPDRKYIFTTDETLPSPVGRLKVWNVQDLSNIILERIWVPSDIFKNCGVHNVELYGNLLVSVYYGAGVKLFDISNPVNPVEIGWYDTFPESNENMLGGWGVYMFPSGKIIATDYQTGFFALRYSPPQNAPPKADFMADKNTVYSLNDTVQFIDCSSNSPVNYQWTMTGNQTISSAETNPRIKFTYPGYYSIKLKVSNAYGADSVVKENFRISGTLLHSFAFYGNTFFTLLTDRSDTSKIKIGWSSASAQGLNTTYQFKIKKFGTNTEYSFASDYNGSDTSITFRKSRLDSICNQLGFTGDSIVTICRAMAYNFSDSIQTGNTLRITIRSTSVGIQNFSSQVPDAYKLENNFPNPFNPSTNIKFQLPYNSFVQLIIYDMLGREVTKLLTEELNAGYYNYEFNAENFNSGVYFYKLVTEKFSETKKMVLVK